MDVTAPDGRSYSVRRRWLAWRQRIPLDVVLAITLLAGIELVARTVLAPVAIGLRALRVLPWEIEVRDIGARKEAALVGRERVRGWGPSERRIEALATDVAERGAAPRAFTVTVSRDPVSAGDDLDAHDRDYALDDRTSHPTISSLVDALRADAPWVSVAGSPTTWVLRASGLRSPRGKPFAVLVLDRDRRHVDVHPIDDLSYRVAEDGHFHLEYLATQSVERTLARVPLAPRGGSLRDPQA